MTPRAASSVKTGMPVDSANLLMSRPSTVYAPFAAMMIGRSADCNRSTAARMSASAACGRRPSTERSVHRFRISSEDTTSS